MNSGLDEHFGISALHPGQAPLVSSAAHQVPNNAPLTARIGKWQGPNRPHTVPQRDNSYVVPTACSGYACPFFCLPTVSHPPIKVACLFFAHLGEAPGLHPHLSRSNSDLLLIALHTRTRFFSEPSILHTGITSPLNQRYNCQLRPENSTARFSTLRHLRLALVYKALATISSHTSKPRPFCQPAMPFEQP